MNIFFTLLVSLLAFFYLIIFKPSAVLVLFMTLKNVSYLLMLTFSLSAILKYCAEKFPHDLFRFRLCRYAASFGTAVLLQMIVWPVFAFLAEVEWRFDDMDLVLTFLMEAVFFTILLLLLQDFAIIRLAKRNAELENSTLQLRTAQAEILLLKQQIHPHFLFNSLNTLKALYKKDIILGEKYLIQLAAFLRTGVSLNSSTIIPLEQEVEFCRNYLQMQQLRFGSALEWEIHINDPGMLQGKVPAFSLQPLAENAIKHNKFTIQHPLKIIIEQKQDLISLSNSINQKQPGETSLKSGLANLAERCLICSGSEISISNNGLTFSVAFKITDP